MHRPQSMADQLAIVHPIKPLAPVIPLPRREAQRAAIEAVPVRVKHPRSLRRFWLDQTPQKSDRERTTFRRVKAAAPALLVRDFDMYNDALQYSRSIGGHKPLRMLDGPALYWRIVSPNLTPSVAEWVNVGHWVKPFRSYCDPSSIAETLDSIPDFSEA